MTSMKNNKMKYEVYTVSFPMVFGLDQISLKFVPQFIGRC